LFELSVGKSPYGKIQVVSFYPSKTLADLQTDPPKAGQTRIRVQNPRDPLADSKPIGRRFGT